MNLKKRNEFSFLLLLRPPLSLPDQIPLLLSRRAAEEGGVGPLWPLG